MTMTTATTTTDRSCCAEGERAGMLTRRSLLKAFGAGAALATTSPLVGMRAAFAAGPWTGDVVVVLSLRGGFDGLSAVAPIGDANYVLQRPTINIPSASAFQLDSMFGMHPALSALQPVWTAGNLAFVHAAGMTAPNRSHFSAMDEMERAAPGSSARSGWLDRTIGLHDAGGPFGAVQMGSSSIPESLAGPYPVLGMNSINGFRLQGPNSSQRPVWATALNALHSSAPAGLQDSAATTLGALSTAATLATAGYSPANGATYPGSSVGNALRNSAQLIKANVGLRVLTIDLGDWDMHVNLGRADNGWMHDNLIDLGNALGAFAKDLGPSGLAGVTLVTISEFGRRVQENESGGVDHGWGNLMMVMGGHVAQGVHLAGGTWPGLADANLTQGDLTATTDYRAVLADVLYTRTNASAGEIQTVFPGFSGTTIGVTTP
jgi:uncharacterized protein (DUF1501 family)